MNFVTIFGIAVALAMDAFAVAVTTGMHLQTVNSRQIFRLSWHFGLFQALMPILGWNLGAPLQKTYSTWDHWIAFTLVALVGSNMIREAFSKEEGTQHTKNDTTKGLSLVTLSIATSIDALAVGLSLSILNQPILYPALIIGLVAATFTIAGMLLGQKIANISRFQTWAEFGGGIVLWIIGLNTLREHGVFTGWLE